MFKVLSNLLSGENRKKAEILDTINFNKILISYNSDGNPDSIQPLYVGENGGKIKFNIIDFKFNIIDFNKNNLFPLVVEEETENGDGGIILKFENENEIVNLYDYIYKKPTFEALYKNIKENKESIKERLSSINGNNCYITHMFGIYYIFSPKSHLIGDSSMINILYDNDGIVKNITFNININELNGQIHIYETDRKLASMIEIDLSSIIEGLDFNISVIPLSKYRQVFNDYCEIF